MRFSRDRVTSDSLRRESGQFCGKIRAVLWRENDSRGTLSFATGKILARSFSVPLAITRSLPADRPEALPYVTYGTLDNAARDRSLVQDYRDVPIAVRDSGIDRSLFR